jgi:hypothetical protein
MTETEIRKLVGGKIPTTVTMPGYPFFVTKKINGQEFEVAVKMRQDQTVQEVSFKEMNTPNKASQGTARKLAAPGR